MRLLKACWGILMGGILVFIVFVGGVEFVVMITSFFNWEVLTNG